MLLLKVLKNPSKNANKTTLSKKINTISNLIIGESNKGRQVPSGILGTVFAFISEVSPNKDKYPKQLKEYEEKIMGEIKKLTKKEKDLENRGPQIKQFLIKITKGLMLPGGVDKVSKIIQDSINIKRPSNLNRQLPAEPYVNTNMSFQRQPIAVGVTGGRRKRKSKKQRKKRRKKSRRHTKYKRRRTRRKRRKSSKYVRNQRR